MVIDKIGTDTAGRQFALIDIPSFGEWQSIPFEWLQSFCLFLACDAEAIDTAVSSDMARNVIERGCAAVCTWGFGCEQLHDVFDEEFVALELRGGKPFKGTLMTTWHAGDSLEDALDYFVNVAVLDEKYAPSPRVWLAVSVGSVSQAAQMRSILYGLLTKI